MLAGPLPPVGHPQYEQEVQRYKGTRYLHDYKRFVHTDTTAHTQEDDFGKAAPRTAVG